MSPSDFDDLFPKLKEPLRGEYFEDLEALKVDVASQIRRINCGCLATGIGKLHHRWNSVIEVGEAYIEGICRNIG